MGADMTRFEVTHRTEYRYGAPMADGFSELHLTPRGTEWQTVLEHSLRIDPEPDEYEESLDLFGNGVVRFAVHRPHEHLAIESHLVAEVSAATVVDDGTPWERVAADAVRPEFGAWLARTPSTPMLASLDDLVRPEFVKGRPVIEALTGVCHRIFTEFRFDPTATDVSTPLHDVLEHRVGVCQDFAHVAVAAFRSVGLPARYVSGYIETLPPPGMPKMVGVDASHAWCSVWAGAAGWVDLDPTNDQLPPRRHVTLGWGRDYEDVAPVRGVVIGSGGSQELTVAVDVNAVG